MAVPTTALQQGFYPTFVDQRSYWNVPAMPTRVTI